MPVKQPTCPGCGGPREEYTPGCQRCSARHSRWRATGNPQAKDPIPGKTTCANCGCPLDACNPDCDVCRKREYSRAKRENRKPSVPPRTKQVPRKTDNEIRATVEYNRKTLDAYIKTRRARLAKTQPAPRTPISIDITDMISESRAIEITGCTRTSIRRAIENGDLQHKEVQHGTQTRRFLSRTAVIIWATKKQRGRNA